MALKFKCQNCSGDIVATYLKRGEVAECKHCGSKNVVPEAAIETKEKPGYTQKVDSTREDISSLVGPRASSKIQNIGIKQIKCPKCGVMNPDNALICDCGYDFTTDKMKESYEAKKINCYLYFEQEDKSRTDVIELLKTESHLEHEKIQDLLSTNDMFTFDEVTKERAIDLIAKFEQLGIVGSIGPLKKKYQQKFKIFLTGAKDSWNGWGFIFNFFWLISKGLWIKLLFYIISQTILLNLIPPSLYFAPGLGFCIYLGMFCNYDYYLKKSKGEALWPKLSYKKIKIPFWVVSCLALVVFLVRPMYVSIKYIQEPRKIESLHTEMFSFETIPLEWLTFAKPPVGMLIYAEYLVEGNSSETIEFTSVKGTQLIAIMFKEPFEMGEKNQKTIGVIFVVLEKPTMWKQFTSTREWMEEWAPKETIEPHYYETISGTEWGIIKSTEKQLIMGKELISYLTAYRTVIDGHLLHITSHSFSVFREEVEKQTLIFLSSFKLKDIESEPLIPEKKDNNEK